MGGKPDEGLGRRRQGRSQRCPPPVLIILAGGGIASLHSPHLGHSSGLAADKRFTSLALPFQARSVGFSSN